jgi:hypothetical protein
MIRPLKLVPFAAVALALSGCGRENATLLYVKVTGKPGISNPRALDVLFTHEGATQTRRLTPGGAQPIALPTDFVIRADGRAGPVQVRVKAVDGNNRVVGEGSGSSSLLPDQQMNLELTLYPYDFQVNSRPKFDQIFSTRASGRQLDADARGRFVVVWEDQSPQLTKFDIWYRMFDQASAPRINAAFGDREEHPANKEASHYHDHPAVAVQRQGASAGSFLVAYQHSNTPSAPSDVRGRVLKPNGTPNSAAGAGGEVRLSNAGRASVPDASPLEQGGYVVVWQQEDPGHSRWNVMGRLLDASGRPASSPGGGSGPFTVATFDQLGQSGPEPVVVGGDNGGFLVLWRQRGNLRGTTYAAPRDNHRLLRAGFAVAGIQTGKVQGFNAGRLLYGYVAAWTDTRTFHDTSDTSIQLRRLDFQGRGLEVEWAVNTSTAGAQRHPALAMTEGGSLLVAWSTLMSTSVDPNGGVRGRLLLSNGLPVGNDFRINTTTAKAQHRPTVSPHGRDSFVVVFVDQSAGGPDSEGSGIRGRLYYGQPAPRNGGLGALCDAGSTCNPSLTCRPTQTGTRCLAACAGPGKACRHGGTCTPDGAGGFYCKY